MRYDKVNLFGLSSSGKPMGLSASWGALMASGVSTGTEIAVDELSSTLDRHAPWIGLAAGALASGGMIAFPSTRHAGWTGLAVSLMTQVPRGLQKMFSTKKQLQQQAITPEQVDAAKDVSAAGTQQGLRLNPIKALAALRLNPTAALAALRLNPTQALAGLGQPRMLSGAGQAALLGRAGAGHRSTLMGGRR